MKEKQGKGIMVSIIIPVYNVEKYIDQCMESVTGQTYRDLEIIIVYDECEDNSYARCQDWSQKDDRIRLIVNQNRKGLAAARNSGILQATGEFVMFVDSDDWLDSHCVQVMLDAIIRSGADFVASSSYFETRPEETSIRHGMPEGLYQTEEMRELLLCDGYVTMWNKLYRRKWLSENQLTQPELYYYEDWGTYPTMITAAKAIYVSSRSCVYYRLGREGSLSSDNEAAIIRAFRKTMKFMFEHLEKQEKWDSIWRFIRYYCFRDYYGRKLANLKSGNRQAGEILENIRKEEMIARFGAFDFFLPNYIVLGSFSLRWEVQKGCLLDSKTERHFCFSSLISIFSAKCNQGVTHPNSFRQKQLEQEMEGVLLKEIEKADDRTLFFLDFLEERFDILEVSKGTYITESDAFKESGLNASSKYMRRIKSGSDEHMKLWRKACDGLLELIRRNLRPEQIVLVKNRMSLTYGNFTYKKPYESERELKGINQMLGQMEEYFIEHMPDITVVENSPEYLFTDDQFRLGCYPEYANNAWYMKVGLQIFEKIA